MTAMVAVPASTRRSGGGRLWRVVVYLVAFLAVMGSMAFLGRGSLWANLATHAVAVALVIALTYGARRYVDRRSWREIGLVGPVWRSGAIGFGAGVAAIITYLAVVVALGWGSVTGTEATERGVVGAGALVGVGLFLYAASAVVQEVAFRGYLLQTLADGWSMRGAAVVSSLIFAALHFTGVPTPLFALVLLADLTLISCFFVLTRLSTGALWMAIGFHTAWNWSQDRLFSLDTEAGADYGNSLVHVRLDAPSLMLGPNGGAELLYLLTSALLFGGYWLFTRQRRAAGGLA